MTKLTISIVNFNSGEYLLNCLKSLQDTKLDLDIFVVDNDSKDNSLELAKSKFPKINYIETGENLGFGKANNLVLRKLKTELVLILNPDTEVSSGVLENLVSYMENNPDVGVVSCKVTLENGKIDWASHRGFPTPTAAFKYYMLGDDSLYHQTNKDLTKPHEVDAISGAFFLTRRSVLNSVGIFDEDYFMYAEDLDLCFRIKESGFKIMYLPEVSIIHHKGVSSGLKEHSQKVSTADLETKKRSLNAFYGTMKIFYKKHLEKKYPFFINWLVYTGIDLKWFLAKRKFTV